MSERTRQNRTAYLWVALACLPILTFIWLFRFVPTHDGPAHLGAIGLARQLDAGWWAGRLVSNAVITPSLQAAVVQLLWDPVGPVAAQKVFLSLYALGLPLSLTYCSRGLANLPAPPASSRPKMGTGLLAGLMGALLVPGWMFFMGFFDFLAGAVCSVAAVGALARALDRSGVWRWVLTGIFLTLAALAHPLLGVFGGCCAGVLALASPGRARHLVLLLLSALPALAVLVWFAGTEVAHLRSVPAKSLSPIETVWGFIDYTVAGGTYWSRFFAIPILASLVCAAVSWRRQSLATRALLGVSLLCFAAYSVAPFHLAAWAFFKPRFVLLGLLVGLPLVNAVKPMVRRGLVVSCFVVAPLGLVPLASAWSDASNEVQLYVEASGYLRSQSMVLPLTFAPGGGMESSNLVPLPLADGYFATEPGVLTPYLFTWHRSHPVLVSRGFPPHPPPHVWRLFDCDDSTAPAGEASRCELEQHRFAAQLGFGASGWDFLVLHRPPAMVLETLNEPGPVRFESVFRNESTRVLRPQLGSLRLSLPPAVHAVEAVANLILLSQNGRVELGRLRFDPRQPVLDVAGLVAGRYRVHVVGADGDSRHLLAAGPTEDGAYLIEVRGGQTFELSIEWATQ